MDTIGKRIKAAREALELVESRQIPHAEMAAKVGVSRESWRKWEADESAPERARIADIAQALKRSPEWIEFGRESAEHQTLTPVLARILSLLKEFPEEELPYIERSIWDDLALSRLRKNRR